MAGKLFVFDLDDTLMDNVHDYARPILRMCQVVIDELGSRAPHVSALVALEQEVDLSRRNQINPKTGKVYGYSMDRFPTSLVETYITICKRSGVEPNKSTESALYYIGIGAFDAHRYKNNIKPGAVSAISFLRGIGDRIVLCTAGDPVIQYKKIRMLESANITFDDVAIVEKKTVETFSGLAGDFEGLKYSVGNNYRSDILPALEVGYRGIYIPVETWETIGQMDNVLAEVDSLRCDKLHSLYDIQDAHGGLK